MHVVHFERLEIDRGSQQKIASLAIPMSGPALTLGETFGSVSSKSHGIAK
jgi:hypothetical protein